MNAYIKSSCIQSTAGAVPVRNEKGEVSMQKVKVQRYVSGKRPDYANDSESDNSDFESFLENRKVEMSNETKHDKHRSSYQDHHHHHHRNREQHNRRRHSDDDDSDNEMDDNVDDRDHNQVADPRLKRLQFITRLDKKHLEYERNERHRRAFQPEIEEDSSDSEKDNNDDDKNEQQVKMKKTDKITLASESDSDCDLSETELDRKRTKLRQRMLQQQEQEEVLQKEEENNSASSDLESSEYEVETESEEEYEPRLKPLFVRKNFRATIQEKETMVQKAGQTDAEAKQFEKQRRQAALRMVEECIKNDMKTQQANSTEPHINDVCTDDENDEVEYEAWKLRELKRVKRDREERENNERDKLEIDRMRTLTEEERRQELRVNPKIITNKATKGKYKFLQKYYHRGAFYLDEENDVLKRDFAQATLEDHFDKTILPKVMQVKNFGRCGRTKYTHLVDQDTTKFDSPWYAETTHNVKFSLERAGGMKQVFDRAGLSKRAKLQ